MIHFKTTLTIVSLLTFCLVSTQGIVFAEDIAKETGWVMVGDSPHLDRSSKYLFKGNISGGIKYAKKALARSQSRYVRVIAHHNLCIAFTGQGELELAVEHCAAAQRASFPEVKLKQVKPGLYKVTRGNASRISLDSVIAQNLEIHGPGKQVKRIVRAN